MKPSPVGSFKPNRLTRSILVIWLLLREWKGIGLLGVLDYCMTERPLYLWKIQFLKIGFPQNSVLLFLVHQILYLWKFSNCVAYWMSNGIPSTDCHSSVCLLKFIFFAWTYFVIKYRAKYTYKYNNIYTSYAVGFHMFYPSYSYSR